MAHPVSNINDKRAMEQMAAPNLPPPEVAVARPHPKRKDWALNAIGIGAIFALCYFGEEILVVILISIFLAFILAPVSDLFARMKLPRWTAAGIAVGLLMLGFSAVTYYGVSQASNLMDQLPKYSHELRAKASKIIKQTKNLEVLNPSPEKDAIKVHETSSLTDLLSRGFGSATEIALTASFVPVLVFFMLTWQEHARAATVGLFPLEHRRQAFSALGQIAKMIKSFMIGNVLIALLIGGISTVVFGFLGVPFFYFAGVLSGFLSLVPYLGAILAVLPPLFVGVGKLSTSDIGWIVVTAFAAHIIAMNVLYPKFLGSRLRLNPLAVTIALLLWAFLWGAVGLLLAVPITAGMKIVFDHVESLKPFGCWLGEDCPPNGTNGHS
jgi:predicted PurR-regulated permease PerM